MKTERDRAGGTYFPALSDLHNAIDRMIEQHGITHVLDACSAALKDAAESLSPNSQTRGILTAHAHTCRRAADECNNRVHPRQKIADEDRLRTRYAPTRV